MVFAASQRARRKPAAPSLGCRGPIRICSKPKSPCGEHQSQMTGRNNAVSRRGKCELKCNGQDACQSAASLRDCKQREQAVIQRERTMLALTRRLVVSAAFASAAALATSAQAEK